MFMSIVDFRGKDKNYLCVRQGDIVCQVIDVGGWFMVYFEDNPKKFGFVPGTGLTLIS